MQTFYDLFPTHFEQHIKSPGVVLDLVNANLQLRGMILTNKAMPCIKVSISRLDVFTTLIQTQWRLKVHTVCFTLHGVTANMLAQFKNAKTAIFTKAELSPQFVQTQTPLSFPNLQTLILHQSDIDNPSDHFLDLFLTLKSFSSNQNNTQLLQCMFRSNKISTIEQLRVIHSKSYMIHPVIYTNRPLPPHAFIFFQNLKLLHLHHVQIQSFQRFLAEIPNIQHITLSEFASDEPYFIPSLAELQTLSLNRVTVMEIHTPMPKLTNLMLSHVLDLEVLDTIPSLKFLHISHCNELRFLYCSATEKIVIEDTNITAHELSSPVKHLTYNNILYMPVNMLSYKKYVTERITLKDVALITNFHQVPPNTIITLNDCHVELQQIPTNNVIRSLNITNMNIHNFSFMFNAESLTLRKTKIFSPIYWNLFSKIKTLRIVDTTLPPTCYHIEHLKRCNAVHLDTVTMPNEVEEQFKQITFTRV